MLHIYVTPQSTWLLLGAPLLEELVFRAGLHHRLLSLQVRRPVPTEHIANTPLTPPAWTANATVALAFMTAHLLRQPATWALATLAPALLIGLLYERTRSAFACVLAHALCNGLWLLAQPPLARP